MICVRFFLQLPKVDIQEREGCDKKERKKPLKHKHNKWVGGCCDDDEVTWLSVASHSMLNEARNDECPQPPSLAPFPAPFSGWNSIFFYARQSSPAVYSLCFSSTASTKGVSYANHWPKTKKNSTENLWISIVDYTNWQLTHNVGQNRFLSANIPPMLYAIQVIFDWVLSESICVRMIYIFDLFTAMRAAMMMVLIQSIFVMECTWAETI